MIKFNNLCEEKPYLVFKEKYDAALDSAQKNIEAITISSFNKNNKRETLRSFIL